MGFFVSLQLCHNSFLVTKRHRNLEHNIKFLFYSGFKCDSFNKNLASEIYVHIAYYFCIWIQNEALVFYFVVSYDSHDQYMFFSLWFMSMLTREDCLAVMFFHWVDVKAINCKEPWGCLYVDGECTNWSRFLQGHEHMMGNLWLWIYHESRSAGHVVDNCSRSLLPPLLFIFTNNCFSICIHPENVPLFSY